MATRANQKSKTSILAAVRETASDLHRLGLTDALKINRYAEDHLSKELANELKKASDRSVAIVGAAWVEEALSAIITMTMLQNKKLLDKFFGSSGAVGAFSPQIDLACLLGLIDDDVRADLHVLRKIRNEFAHRIFDSAETEILNFQTEQIKDWCLGFKSLKNRNITDPRLAFIKICTLLTNNLYFSRQFCKPPERVQVCL